VRRFIGNKIDLLLKETDLKCWWMKVIFLKADGSSD
jgi:hypothetical protein